MEIEWNALPTNMFSANTLEDFTNKLDKHMTAKGWTINTKELPSVLQKSKLQFHSFHIFVYNDEYQL